MATIALTDWSFAIAPSSKIGNSDLPETVTPTEPAGIDHSATSTRFQPKRTNVMRMESNAGSKNGRILIKANYQLVPVNLEEILFIKALSDYVIIKTTNGKYITLSTMKDMVKKLPDEQFVRSHRSFIVNMDRINSVKGSTIEVMDRDMRYSVPIGRAYKKEFKESLNAA